MKQAKRMASVLTILLLLCSWLAVSTGAKTVVQVVERSAPSAQNLGDAGLKFRQDGTYKIIQVSDLQEAYFTSTITKEFLYDVAEKERPDLFILTGDNISDNAMNWGTAWGSRPFIKASIDSFMDVFDKIYAEFGARVTMVFGNHDAEAAGVSRAEQFAMYQAHPSFVGYLTDADAGTMGKNGPHAGTHNLLIKNSSGSKAVFNLWMFDSGDYATDGSGYDSVQKPQIDWFKATNKAVGKLPSLAFQHIVVPEIYDYLTPAAKGAENTFSNDIFDQDGQRVTRTVSRTLPAGVKGTMREAPAPGMYSYGQYAALNKSGNVLAMFFGHDHVNTFELKRKGTDLINTQCAGFGSYGDVDLRGVRVITLREDNLKTYGTRLVTYADFYGENALRTARLNLFQTLRTFGTVIDVLIFKPLLWVQDLF